MIIASDFDGTLKVGPSISEENRRAVATWRAAGHLFGVVTGRGVGDMLALLKDELDCDFILCNNGAELYDCAYRLLAREDLPGDLLPQLIEQLMTDFSSCMYITQGCDRRILFMNEGQVRGQEKRGRRIGLDEIRFVERFSQVDIHYRDPEEARQMADAFNRGPLAGRVYAHQNGWWINATAPGVSKAEGIRRYLTLTGKGDLAQVIAVGDNYNDIDMIERYRGYAMEASPESVKARAARVCASVASLIEREQREALP